MAKRDGTFARPSSLVFEIAADLEALIIEMMTPEVELRVQDMAEVVRRLAVLRGVPVRASTGSLVALMSIPLIVLLVAIALTRCSATP